MDQFISDATPFDRWSALLFQRTSPKDLYTAIALTLADKCFTDDVASVMSMLHQAIPLMDEELRRVKPQNRILKLVMDIARSVGFYDIAITKREEEKRLIFEASLVLLLYFNEDLFVRSYSSIENLLEKYPEFEQLDDIGELDKLFHFTNFMICAQVLLPPKGKKSHLLDLVTRIVEGCKHKYVTGGGQTSATALRVLIYEREGGIIMSLFSFIPYDSLSLIFYFPYSSPSTFTSFYIRIHAYILVYNHIHK